MFFITGTDTGVGKTFFSNLLLRGLRAGGLDAAGFKPICCGDRADAETLVAASANTLTLNQCNPVWLRAPVSPYAASMMESRQIDLGLIFDQYQQLKARVGTVLVEGVGGWRVPIRQDYFVSDLAAEIGLPILVVVSNKLGALNHTLLTLESIRQSGQTCAGIILNHLEVPDDDASVLTNRSVLEQLTEIPILLELSLSQPGLSSADVQRVARSCAQSYK